MATAAIALACMAAGCAQQQKSAPIQPGASEKSAQKCGGAVRAEVAAHPGTTQYDCGGCSYEVENGTVTATSCLPQGKQVSLQYWRQLWKGQAPKFEALKGDSNPHGQSHYQLVSPQTNSAVVYDASRDRVIRVVNFARR